MPQSQKSRDHPRHAVGRGTPHTARAGLTLVEMLVVTTILMVIAGGMAASFVSGMKLWDRARRVDIAASEAWLVLDLMARELRQGVEMSSVGFEGDAESVSFPAVLENVIVTITYSFDPSRQVLLRREIDWLDVLEHRLKADVRERILLSVDQFRCAYLKNTVKGFEWQQTLDPDGGIPYAIRIELRLGEETVTKTVMLPIA